MCARVLLASLLLAGASGCFQTRRVNAEGLFALRAGELGEDALLPEGDDARPGRWFAGVRIDPNSDLRLRRNDGTFTSWVNARALRVSEEGLFVSSREVDWEEIESIVVNELTAEELDRLRLTAPEGAKVKSATSRYVQLHPYGADARAWLAEFARACADAMQPLPGRWTLMASKAGPLPAMDGPELLTALGGRIQVADGIRWADVDAADISNLDGALTYLAIIIVPFSVVAGQVPLGEGLWAQSLGVQTAEVQEGGTRVLGRTDLTAPRLEGIRPLFADEVLRKSSLRWEVWVSGATQLTRFEQVAATIGGGVRVREVFELGAGASAVWRAPLSQGNRLPGPPLQPGGDARVPTMIVLVRALLHLDVDAGRRVALPLGADFGGSLDGTLQMRLRYGVRLRPADSFAVGIYPFNAQLTVLPAAIDPGVSAWTFPWSLEVLRTF